MRTATLAAGAATLCFVLLVAGCGGGNAAARPSPSGEAVALSSPPAQVQTSPVANVATSTAVATATPAGTPTPEPTPTVTNTPTVTPTVTPVFVQTPLPRERSTPTPAPPTPSSLAPVVRLRIPAIGLDAGVEAVGQDANGQLGVPTDAANVAWYSVFKRPGVEGNAVFAGFQFADGKPGPFRRLIETKAGDEVLVVLDDGVVYRYRVISSARYLRSEVPDSEVVFPSYQPRGTQWLTLFTDGGDLSGESATHFDMVLAERRDDR